MKVKIIVWIEKPNDGFGLDTITEYDGFRNPEVVGLRFPIERCTCDNIDNCLKVYLAKYPARVDADPRFQIIHLLDSNSAEYYTEAYTLLDQDKGQGIILWTRPPELAIVETLVDKTN